MNMDSSLDSDLITYLSGNNPMLQCLIDTLPVPIFYKDKVGIYLGCNRAFEDFIKIERSQLIGNNVFQLFDRELAEIYHSADQALFDNPGIQNYEGMVRSTQGDERYVKFHKTSFEDNNNEVAGLIGIIFDITAQKQLESKLTEQATYDSLTGLYNRREGLNRVGELYELTRRNKMPLAVLMLDVDHFKRVNDQYGHQVGDQALHFIANTLRQTSRKSDVLVRYGGEEFLIFLPNVAEGDAITFAERYRTALAKKAMRLSKSQRLHLTVSIGISCYRQQTLTDLIHEADIALYEAKSRDRNTVCSY
ncbi:diguanylate cyclase with PAS/PAC sensor [Shewanella sediminis HAW-EB3]|uniref:diguanylate cyclase n=1 Tax=Shewanella sediminis (strain HAW-EB3) TaxID=425104 RepID=A8FVB8_SHESH|nr:GGDEF domain-containing protein [Shewanella sediminis]ABV36791.1 diguanylate cyclase with PAS/PAC sensor [Shewanella sediminis HAW-EB3]